MMPAKGLEHAEATRRLGQYGPNALPDAPRSSLLSRWLHQFASPIIGLLLFALVFDICVWLWEGHQGVPFEGIAIAAILLLNSSLGVYQEYRADSALGKLKDLAAPMVWVYRDGSLTHLLASQLVPGDVVKIEAGDRIPADGLLQESSNAMLDESMLTGESVPLEKESGAEVFSGTQLVRGRSLVNISRTGPESALGKLALSLASIRVEETPLEKKLKVFGNLIAQWIVVLCVLLFVLGIALEGFASFSRVMLFAVALAVAAVPEGMPAVLTLTLARGIERMAVRKAVVRRMSAVEALGSVTVIATDKTGTLTENRMFVSEVLSDRPGEALLAMMLANDADPGAQAGDPLELALYAYAAASGLDPVDARRANPRLDILPFDSAIKFMRVTCDGADGPAHYLKGAPEVLLPRCLMSESDRERWHQVVDESASKGHRLLALASGDSTPDMDLTFLGVVLLWDPPRPEVPEAIHRARTAGVRLVMVTGDHPATALAIAHSIGLPSAGSLTGDELRKLSTLPADINVFARVLPEDKLRLIDLLKAQGEVVAMTGDGVNDAPALKRADVGIAMGQRGSDVTREVADLVLLDDNFATLVSAIEQGRGIYANIQKFIRFLFSTNLTEVIVVMAGALGSVVLNIRTGDGSLLLPLTAVQLLWVNLVTDGPVALALGLDENAGLMYRRPRHPGTPLLDVRSARYILVVGIGAASVALGMLVLLPRLGVGLETVRTAMFHYLVLVQVATSYPARGVMRSRVNNWGLAGAVVFGGACQVIVAVVPALQKILGLQPITMLVAAIIGACVLVSWLGAELYIRLTSRRRSRPA